jgi:hypothetical protein
MCSRVISTTRTTARRRRSASWSLTATPRTHSPGARLYRQQQLSVRYALQRHSFRSAGDGDGPRAVRVIRRADSAALAFPIRLQGEFATNGAPIDVTDDTFDSAPFVDWQPGYCDSHFSAVANSDTFVCVYTGGYLAGQTVVQYDWSGQAIRYHSNTYSKVWGDDTSEPSYQASDFEVNTPLVTFGPDLTGRLAIYSGGGDTPVASAVNAISLSPDVQRLDVISPSCTPDLFPPVTCFESHFLLTGNFGYTDFGSWPVYTP